ncbi:hypothetical protein BGZ83_000124 [Gryganskiella cystojenkinii]|nr:hypothetical protein BGZ83_000124 [Gryganskiella cystojenkinii]
MYDLKEYDPKNTKDPIAYWEERLDLDGFLKSMAMEYLTGYGIRTGTKDQTISSTMTPSRTNGPDFRLILMTRSVLRSRKLIIETPEINARFEAILKDTVNYVFKPDAWRPRMEAYKKMIQQDLEHYFVTELGSPYGLAVVQQEVKNTGTTGGAGGVTNKDTQRITFSGDITSTESARSQSGEKLMNSAAVLKSNLAALSAVLVMVVLIL